MSQPECGVCFYGFQDTGGKRPLSLRCGHSYCFDCVTSLSQPRRCPTCSAPVLNLNQIPTNFAIVQGLSLTSTSGPQLSAAVAGSATQSNTAELALDETINSLRENLMSLLKRQQCAQEVARAQSTVYGLRTILEWLESFYSNIERFQLLATDRCTGFFKSMVDTVVQIMVALLFFPMKLLALSFLGLHSLELQAQNTRLDKKLRRFYQVGGRVDDLRSSTPHSKHLPKVGDILIRPLLSLHVFLSWIRIWNIFWFFVEYYAGQLFRESMTVKIFSDSDVSNIFKFFFMPDALKNYAEAIDAIEYYAICSCSAAFILSPLVYALAIRFPLFSFSKYEAALVTYIWPLHRLQLAYLGGFALLSMLFRIGKCAICINNDFLLKRLCLPVNMSGSSSSTFNQFFVPTSDVVNGACVLKNRGTDGYDEGSLMLYYTGRSWKVTKTSFKYELEWGYGTLECPSSLIPIQLAQLRTSWKVFGTYEASLKASPYYSYLFKEKTEVNVITKSSTVENDPNGGKNLNVDSNPNGGKSLKDKTRGRRKGIFRMDKKIFGIHF